MSGGANPSLTITVKGTTKQVNPFNDVKKSDWFYDAVMDMLGRGLMIGTADDKFDPSGTLSRAMIVTVLYRHAGKPVVSGLNNPFDDLADGQWYTGAVKWAAANGIVTGKGNGKFGPDENITRQDFAVILYRYAGFAGMALSVTRDDPDFLDDADIANYAKEAVEAFFKAGIIDGKPGNRFDPQGSATRVEFAVMIHRMLEATTEN